MDYLHDDIERDELDQHFIKMFMDDEKIFEKFYNKPVNNVKVKFYYLETNNEIYKTKEFNLKFFDTVVKKENILFLLKNNQYFDNCKHKLTYLLKYNFDIDYTNIKNFLENKIEKSITYLTSYKIIQDVYFKDTISFFSDLNSLIFIMKKCSNSNCTTKKIYLK